MDKASFVIWNVFFNSLLTFFTVVLLIEGLIFLFRIKQGRVPAFLRMIPILKLPFDLCMYDFSRWSYAKGINPLDCEAGTRTLSVAFEGIYSSIQFTIPGNWTFTIADVIGYRLSPFVLRAFLFLFIGLTLGLLIRRVLLYYRSILALGSLKIASQPLDRKIQSSALSLYVKKCGVRVMTSPILLGSPFVAGLISSVVYVPSSLSQNLSRKEYEAVLAHEMEHVRFKDSFVRLVLDFIGAVFWWVPTKWLCKRIEEGQEVGCDLQCAKYGVDPTDLVSAVYKSAKFSKNIPNHIFAHHLTKHTICKRVNILLQPTSIKHKKLRFILTCLVIAAAVLVVFFGKFWTF